MVCGYYFFLVLKTLREYTLYILAKNDPKKNFQPPKNGSKKLTYICLESNIKRSFFICLHVETHWDSYKQTREHALSGYQDIEKRVEKTKRSDDLWPNSRCLLSWWNTVSTDCYIFSEKRLIKKTKILKSAKSMLIKTEYLNHCVTVMVSLVWTWRIILMRRAFLVLWLFSFSVDFLVRVWTKRNRFQKYTLKPSFMLPYPS